MNKLQNTRCFLIYNIYVPNDDDEQAHLMHGNLYSHTFSIYRHYNRVSCKGKLMNALFCKILYHLFILNSYKNDEPVITVLAYKAMQKFICLWNTSIVILTVQPILFSIFFHLFLR